MKIPKKIKLYKAGARKRVLFTVDLFYFYGSKKLKQFGVGDMAFLNIGHGKIKDDYMSENMGKEIANFFISGLNQKNRKVLNFPDEFEKFCNYVWQEAENIQRLPLNNKKDLTRAMGAYKKIVMNYTAYLYVPVLVDPAIEQHLRESLLKWIKSSHQIKTVDELLNLLLTPTKLPLSSIEQKDLLKISYIKNKTKREKFLQRHCKKWRFLSCYNINEKPFGYSYYIERLESLSSVLTKKEKQSEIDNFRELIKKSDKLQTKLNLPSKLNQLITLMRKLVFLRNYKIDVWCYLNFCSQRVLDSVSEFLQLDREYIANATYEEIIQSIRQDKIIPSIQELKNRTGGYGYLFYNGKKEIVTGNNIKKLLSRLFLDKVDKNVKLLKGVPAQKGKVRSKCRIILDGSHVSKLLTGEILVTNMTNPQFLPAMYKSVAIITNEGGMLCHAAIMAREMKKPCIIGTKLATQVLKDGDLVEVDANNGVVKILKR